VNVAQPAGGNGVRKKASVLCAAQSSTARRTACPLLLWHTATLGHTTCAKSGVLSWRLRFKEQATAV
jgi:hypothetical protein